MNTVNKCVILETQHDYDHKTSDTYLEEVRNNPFGLGSVIKGFENVSNDRNLWNYSQELVENFAKFFQYGYELNLTDLAEYEQNELARLYIEWNGREIGECLFGKDFSIDNPFNCALLAMLQNDSHETREQFAQITRKNVLKYYEEALQKILDESCNNYLHNVMNEQGYFARRDLEHGDIVWGKF